MLPSKLGIFRGSYPRIVKTVLVTTQYFVMGDQYIQLMAINKVYVLTEKELKNLLQDQRSLCSDNYIQGLDVITAPEPKLPRQLNEWGIINKIFNKNNE